MAKLKEGMEAPDFTLEANDGKNYTLSQFRGKRVLLYFYPKDNTSGCTLEAEMLRDTVIMFKRAGTQILGVSTDSVSSHQKFADKLKLPFPLLADTKKEVVKKYGVWGKKTMMGKEYMGVNRMSFLIDIDGSIMKIYGKVVPKDHAGEVLTDLKGGTKIAVPKAKSGKK